MLRRIINSIAWVLIAVLGVLAAYDLALLSLITGHMELMIFGFPIGAAMVLSVLFYKTPKYSRDPLDVHFNPIAVSGFFFFIFCFQFAYGAMPEYRPNFLFPM